MAYWGSNPFTSYQTTPYGMNSYGGQQGFGTQAPSWGSPFSGGGQFSMPLWMGGGWGGGWGQSSGNPSWGGGGSMGGYMGSQSAPNQFQMPSWMGMGGQQMPTPGSPYQQGSAIQSFDPNNGRGAGVMGPAGPAFTGNFASPFNRSTMPQQIPQVDPNTPNYAQQSNAIPSQAPAPVGNPQSGPYGIWGSPDNMTNTGGGIFGPATRSLLGL